MSHICSDTVKTIDELQISPPPGSVPATSLPLTFFDMIWLISHPVQRVFFYHLPNSNVSHFRQTILPNLTSSLSLALRYFYPFAARLIAPPRPGKPCILYSDGDSVPLTFAETSLDFDQVTTDLPKDVVYLHPLLPKLPPTEVKPDGTTVSPLLAVKITLFPKYSGICIGFEFCHVAADGSAFIHFMKSWASICKSGGKDLSWIENSPPCLDRSLIKDPRNVADVFLEQVGDSKDPREDVVNRNQLSDKVRTTFVLDGEDIGRFKASVNFQESAFAVASAFVWTNLMKSLDLDETEGEKIDTYVVGADFRSRLEPKLPATYFGNCISGIKVPVKRRQLLGDDGFMVAARALVEGIQGIGGAALGNAEKWISGFEEIFKLGKVVTVAGSSRLGVYETDFGWGRPRKSEPVHIDFSGSVYFSDPRDEERGGLEFGLALSKPEMDAFVALFEKRLKQLRDIHSGF